MKIKAYTTLGIEELASRQENTLERFSSAEHEAMVSQNTGENASSKEDLIRSYLIDNYTKFGALGWFIHTVHENQCKNIVSFGAGFGVLEYLLSMSLPDDAVVIATDFDGVMVDAAAKYLSPIQARRFDFFQDDVKSLCDEIGAPIDLAVFWGSSCVMDDDELIRLLTSLYKAGVRVVMDFDAASMTAWNMIKREAQLWKVRLVRQVRRIPLVNLIAPPSGPLGPVWPSHPGKFHGWHRTPDHLIKQYDAAGWRLAGRRVIPPYNMAGIFKSSRS
ncbi:MAG: hypothetical protein GC154_08925 [bacterium]|nr:hypothetical protein [bacterium]